MDVEYVGNVPTVVAAEIDKKNKKRKKNFNLKPTKVIPSNAQEQAQTQDVTWFHGSNRSRVRPRAKGKDFTTIWGLQENFSQLGTTSLSLHKNFLCLQSSHCVFHLSLMVYL